MCITNAQLLNIRTLGAAMAATPIANADKQ